MCDIFSADLTIHDGGRTQDHVLGAVSLSCLPHMRSQPSTISAQLSYICASALWPEMRSRRVLKSNFVLRNDRVCKTFGTT
jgi:hypothetical protein